MIREIDGAEALRGLEDAALALIAFYTPAFKQQNSVVEEVAAFYSDALAVGFVDIMKQRDIASRYGIRGLPDAVLLQHGSVVARLSGARPAYLYQLAINPRLAARATQPVAPSANIAVAHSFGSAAVSSLRQELAVAG